MNANELYTTGGPYRSRNGMLFGVCRGIAEYFDFSIFWTRLFTLAALLITGFVPVGVLYFCAALMMKRAPLLPSGCDPEWNRRLYRERRRPTGTLDERLRRVEEVMH